MQTNKEDEEYQNQAETEFLTCNFIKSIYWDSYNEKGEINYKLAQDVYVRHVTQNQGSYLVGVLLVIGGMLLAMRYMNQKIANVTGVDGITQGTLA